MLVFVSSMLSVKHSYHDHGLLRAYKILQINDLQIQICSWSDLKTRQSDRFVVTIGEVNGPVLIEGSEKCFDQLVEG